MDTRRRSPLSLAAALAAALVLTACSGGGDPAQNASTADPDQPVTVTITSNAISGGKNAAEADWYQSYVIPGFEEMMAEQGRDVTVEFEPNGVDDEDYKTKIALDLRSGGGADVIAMDGIWIGEFAEAGYIAPLDQVVPSSADWEGWDAIPEAVQQALSFEDQRYGVPQGADGRVLYFNKQLFEQAGLPTDWQPTSWEDVLDAARALKGVEGVVPLQVNAGTAMGEATTMQGVLPLLAGTGAEVWADDQWLGGGQELQDVLGFYKTVYVDEQLGDPVLQQEAQGRDRSFQEFAAGRIGILLEGDYLWRSVINPDPAIGIAPMANRDEVVGYTRIPAQEPGSGIDGQDFVSMSGGGGRVLNPNSQAADVAWELIAFMNSKEAFEDRVAGSPIITPREDVNEGVLANEPMLRYVAEQVLPITAYRPGLAAYPQVSVALQEATGQIVSGASVEEAAAGYQEAVETVVGAENVRS